MHKIYRISNPSIIVNWNRRVLPDFNICMCASTYNIVYFVGVVGVFWVLLNFWRSGQKVSVDEMCPVRVPTNPPNPIATKLPVVKIFGGERGFFSSSHVCRLTVFIAYDAVVAVQRADLISYFRCHFRQPEVHLFN